jgi:hypothetical protein
MSHDRRDQDKDVLYPMWESLTRSERRMVDDFLSRVNAGSRILLRKDSDGTIVGQPRTEPLRPEDYE